MSAKTQRKSKEEKRALSVPGAEFEQVPSSTKSRTAAPKCSKKKSPSKRGSRAKSPARVEAAEERPRLENGEFAPEGGSKRASPRRSHATAGSKKKSPSKRASPPRGSKKKSPARVEAAEERPRLENGEFAPEGAAKSPRGSKKKSPSKRVPSLEETLNKETLFQPTAGSKRSTRPRADMANEQWVKSPTTGRWIRVGGPLYQQLQEQHGEYFGNAEVRKGNLYGRHGCSNAHKYAGQPGPFCGPKRCGANTYPVRGPGEFRAAISYSRYADSGDQEEIRECAERVRATGYKSGGNEEK
jgi:hypothetical protein